MVSEKEYWQKIVAGDEKSFEFIFLHYYEALIRFAAHYHKDYEDQREVVQQVFADLWCKRKDIQIQSSIKAYLYKSVRNRCLNELKHLQVKQKHQTNSPPAPVHTTTSAHSSLIEKELRNRIQKSLQKLPLRTQEIFKLSREEQLKYREIAELLQVSIKTVEFQMGKALSFLRIELIDYLPLILLSISSFF